MSLTKNQENLYNLYLKILRRSQEKPYSLRKNFDNFEKEKPQDYTNILKLDRFFNDHKNINVELFFEAPYKLYEDEEYVSLQYYTTMKAVKSYNTYLKMIEELDPDTQIQLELLKNSLKFIRTFCVENGIDLNKYLKSEFGIGRNWIKHVYDLNISMNSIIGLTYIGYDVQSMVNEIPSDEIELYIPDIVKKFNTMKRRLDGSKIARKFLTEGWKRIIIDINNKLINNTNSN